MDTDIKTVSFNGKQLRYCAFGTGAKPFVILPGLSINRVVESAGAVEDGFAAFKEDYTVYLIDRIDNPPEGYSVEDMADDTAQAMSLIGIEKAVIFGASQGGMIAQVIAVRYPGLAGTLILASTTPRSVPGICGTIGGWIDLAENKKDCDLHMETFRTLFTEEFLSKYESVLPSLCGDLTETERRDFITFAKACLNFDIENEIGKISCPLLITAAKKDRLIPYTMSEIIAEKTGGELFIYEDYGHAVYDEAPDYRERLLTYLKKN